MMQLKTLWRRLPRAARLTIAAAGACAVAGSAVGLTAAATGGPQATAATPLPTPSKGTPCDLFVGHLASDLGKTPSQVRSALPKALQQTLGDLVAQGRLTQQQASTIQGRAGQGCPGQLSSLPASTAARRLAFGLAEYAKALGMTPAQLRQAIRSGQTVEQIAASKGMDEATFRQKLISVVQPDLDQQRQAGHLTQQQENSILQRLRNGPLPLWNQLPSRRSPSPSPSPSPTTT
ncbi:MAG TPA: hypothetical protein VKY90_09560 [Candidatus Dormibacteraeota bacterium]|nr:hypothetical protein [Candidatus Dormibacteraeota bacterium]